MELLAAITDELSGLCEGTRKFPRETSILIRLGTCSPSDIPDFVMAVVVNAVEQMFRRGLPADVIKEFLKRFEAELDPASTVILELTMTRIRAALLCFYVNHVLGGFLASD